MRVSKPPFLKMPQECGGLSHTPPASDHLGSEVCILLSFVAPHIPCPVALREPFTPPRAHRKPASSHRPCGLFCPSEFTQGLSLEDSNSKERLSKQEPAYSEGTLVLEHRIRAFRPQPLLFLLQQGLLFAFSHPTAHPFSSPWIQRPFFHKD